MKRSKTTPVQQVMLSFRVDPVLARRLARHLKQRGERRSAVLRRALICLLDAEQEHPRVEPGGSR